MSRKVISQAVFGLAFLFAAATDATAGAFVVKPVRATLSAANPIASFTVVNTGADATVLQLAAVSWAQQDGKDAFETTKEILATPPIFKVPAGGSQVVRVGVRRTPDAQRELTYRLFLQEVPPAPKPGFQGLNVVLRISVPVFVMPSIPALPAVQWSARRTPKGELAVGIANPGNAHVQIASVHLAGAGGADFGKHDVAVYVLPGQRRELVLKASPPPGTKLQLSAQTDAGEMHADLIVETR